LREGGPPARAGAETFANRARGTGIAVNRHRKSKIPRHSNDYIDTAS
jgi:hypothetical protein